MYVKLRKVFVHTLLNDEIHVNKTKKSICAHFAESPCT